ncbi:MAG: CHAT domain-containing protein [Verrucomicrobiae bacterium]|nr:CHAT domain-containing protein [Verrucomicrobiae bacterium]
MTTRLLASSSCLALFILGLSGGVARDLTQADRDAFARCRELQKAGDWIAAREIARQLEAAFAGDPPSQHRLAFVNELANLEQRLGNYEAALPAYEDCLATARGLLGERAAPVAQIQNNLAALHQVLGDFQEAESLNREALAIREDLEGKGTPGTVPAMNNLAGLLWCIGDLGGAETLYREALAIRVKHLGEEVLDTARSKANLGGLLFYRNLLDEAAPLAREAAGLLERLSGPSHPDTLEALLFLGEIERAAGDPAKALELYRRVAEGRVSALGTREHVEVAEAVRRIGDANRELGDYAEAIRSYRESDELYLGLLREDHPDRQEGLYGLGLAALASGDRTVALEAAKRCLELEFRNFEAMLRFTDERQRLAYQEMFKSHHLLAQLGAAEEVAGFLLRQKGVVLDSLIAEAQLSKESSDPAVLEARRALSAARAEYRSVFLGSDRGGRDLVELEALVRERYQDLIRRTGSRDFSRDDTIPGVAALRGALDDDEVLVDYLRYRRYDGFAAFEERYGVAVTTREETRFFDLCSAGETDDLIAAMIPFFGAANGEGEEADRTARELMGRLYRLLLAPAAETLAKHRKLVVCPEGPLSFVPFACLVGPDGKFLIETFDLSYVTSARELLRPENPGNPAAGAILVGNPAFQAGRDPGPGVVDRRGLLASFQASSLSLLAEGLVPLEGAEEEVGLLAPVMQRQLGTPIVLMKGLEATETGFRSKVNHPHLLHVATHGLYLPAALETVPEGARGLSIVPAEVAGFHNPMFGSCLAFAGSSDTAAAWAKGIVPDPENDGLFMANEVAELDLSGTLLVTLSACDTASGEATRGDGVLGLRRGFRMAGAENVISTLWPISDAATVAIMRQFYEGLASSNPAVSLSATQREWLVRLREKREVSPEDPLPVGGFYWAVNLAGPFLLGR